MSAGVDSGLCFRRKDWVVEFGRRKDQIQEVEKVLGHRAKGIVQSVKAEIGRLKALKEEDEKLGARIVTNSPKHVHATSRGDR